MHKIYRDVLLEKNIKYQIKWDVEGVGRVYIFKNEKKTVYSTENFSEYDKDTHRKFDDIIRLMEG